MAGAEGSETPSGDSQVRPRLLTVEELADQPVGVVREVRVSGRPTIVTEDGRPAVALLSLDQRGQALLTDYVLMNEPEYVRAMDELDAAIAEGQPLETFAEPAAAEGEVKRKLARELHDSVAQQLRHIVEDMESLKHQGGQRQLAEQVDRLEESARDVLSNLHQVLYGLREEQATEEDLPERVRDLLSSLEGRTGIRPQLRVSPEWPSRLAATTSEYLQRIVEQALSNVRLHSGASSVDVEMAASRDRLTVTVSDNGRGLSGSEAGESPGLGMLNMRERAVLLGGGLDVTSSEEEGVSVKVTVPAKAPGRPAE